MDRLRIDLNISAESLRLWYEGRVTTVVASDIMGKTVHFPVRILRSFISHDGVQGQFELDVSRTGQLLDIRKISTQVRQGACDARLTSV